MISLRVDGHPVEVEKGASVLDAARKAGVQIPTLCHQDDLSSPLRDRRGHLFLRDFPSLLQPLSRQVDAERRAPPHLRIHPNVPPVLLYNAVHLCQSQPCALPHGLGGEKGLENVRQDIGRYAGARVRDGQADPLPCLYPPACGEEPPPLYPPRLRGEG